MLIATARRRRSASRWRVTTSAPRTRWVDALPLRCNGKRDCSDPMCADRPECLDCRPEVCSDPISDDCDDWVDCDDDDCADQATENIGVTLRGSEYATSQGVPPISTAMESSSPFARGTPSRPVDGVEYHFQLHDRRPVQRRLRERRREIHRRRRRQRGAGRRGVRRAAISSTTALYFSRLVRNMSRSSPRAPRCWSGSPRRRACRCRRIRGPRSRPSGHSGELLVEAEVVLIVMVASVWVSPSTFTPSLASIAWCRPSE